MTANQKLISRVVEITGSPTEAAAALGVTPASISRYLSGKSEPIRSVQLLACKLVAVEDPTNSN